MRPVGTEELPLFAAPTAPRARVQDPATSKAAARVMRAGIHYRRILDAIEQLGPAIYTELAQACGLPPVAVNRRLAELRRLGRVVRLDETRRTPSGCPAHLYVTHSKG